ncbi:hypothetical protein C8N43_1628 [Litoreibacter ponti]|uniref:Uncharacterized protein n=1 Tax=Litoreibacter ponti TaxID=1510457 RepID=A0A2T6BLK2_9RHOB|nr:hypothetical protein [Litoreibacter ponti]PTX56963.1 hypothetical protein C8N43_1628 [Litoreibacter ponti]
MKNKLIFYPLVIFGSALLIAFTASHFLTVSFDDVLYHKRHVNSDRLNAPWPGKAYAFYKPTGQFEATPLCSLEMADLQIDKDKVTFHAQNTVGKQFSQALSYVMTASGMSKEETSYQVYSVSLDLPLEKSFTSTGEAKFLEYCQDRVAEKAADTDYVVYQVENAYFDFDTETGHNEWKMVSFKPKPVIFVRCEPGAPDNPPQCDNELLDYRAANWVTKVKYMLGLISIS